MKQAKTWNSSIVILGLIAVWFMVSTSQATAVTQHILHEFDFADGMDSQGGVILDPAGNLYGTTFYGGINNCGWGNCGVVYKLSRSADGKWTETILHRFTGPEGSHPSGSLIRDAKGNLYGTTEFGGSHSGGTVFRLTPLKNGKWRHTILYSFGATDDDGTTPFAALALGRKGNLYGTTYSGGFPGRCPARRGCGVVFKLSPGLKDKWTERILYRFNGRDGANPTAGVFRSQEGRLYGTTESGGVFNCAYGCGVAFELTRDKKGVWSETVMHKFTGAADGASPWGGLTPDHHGTFYGATVQGGNQNCYGGGCGVVFKLSRDIGGHWEQTVVYTFNTITEGDGAWDKPILGPDGSLYGDTGSGYGNVYKLTKGTDGNWFETVLFSFNGGSTGWDPIGLVFDKKGNLYGTTDAGGNPKVRQCAGDNGCGLVYQLIP